MSATSEPAALPCSPPLPIFFDNLPSFSEAPKSVAKLRELILKLAVRGKLIEQDENDEPASELLERSFAKKKAFEESGEIKKQPTLSPIQDSEILFDIPSNWCWVRAAQISYPISSGSTPAKTVFQSEPEGGIPYIKVYNIRDQEIDFDYRPQYIDKEHNATKMKRSILVPGMVVLNIVGPPLGKTAIIPETYPRWNCNQAIAFFRLIDDIIPSYFHLFLRAGEFLRNIALVGTAGQDNISVTKCKHIAVPIPPLAEQRRIVSKVDGLMSLCDELESRGSERVRLRERASRSCLDRLASSRSRRDLARAWQRLSDHFEVLYDTPETLAHLRQSILQLAVQGKLVPQDPNDEPASELLRKVIKENQRLIKEKKIRTPKAYPPIESDDEPYPVQIAWEWVRLEELCYQITDGAHHTPTYIPSGIPFLSVKDVSGGVLDFSNTRFISEDQHGDLTKRCKPEFEDVLLTKIGTTGIAKVVDVHRPFSIFVSLALLKFPRQHLFPRYLELMINSPLVKQQSSENTQGVGNKNLVLKHIRNFAVPLPPLPEQKRIVAKVDQLLAKCDELSAQLRNRQVTTQQLLTATIHHLLDQAN